MTTDKGIAILTIEDEPMVRRTLAAYLRKSGFTVHEAGDGAEGLALFERERPDLVLVDLRMPGMDGFAVLEALSAQSPRRLSWWCPPPTPSTTPSKPSAKARGITS